MHRLFILSLLVALTVACRPAAEQQRPAAAPAQPRIVATNYPMAWVAERLAGSFATIELPVPEDEDPAFWEPTAADIRSMQQADMIVLNGADFESWLPTASLPADRLVDTARSFRDRWIILEDAVTHSHGPAGEHTHSGTDAMTWLDPRQALAQATAVREALVVRFPERATSIAGAFESLKADLEDLDARFERALAPAGDRPLVASHPLYNYLARRYALNMRSVHFEVDEMPDDAAWAEFDALLAEHPARIMFWEDEPLDEIASELDIRNVLPVVVLTCGNRPEEGDYLDAMRANARRLEEALR
ncbi:MAG: zinc ABC transporter substrate-binding protein [Candidatus Sumerlaeia bacterium]|nr:zinc ABC transporter substrate-binding protein [Candidatus Sumerlaeia bacterium]